MGRDDVNQVYIVYFMDYEDMEILGVYSAEDKAKEAAKDYIENQKESVLAWGASSMEIVRCRLNEDRIK